MNMNAETASDLRQELGRDAAHLKDSLKHRAEQGAETGKSKALKISGMVTSALGVTADHLRNNPDAPTWMATGFQKVARQIEQLANDLESRSLDDLSRDASRFARDHPATFLAVSAATGFAAARLLRAGADKKSDAKDENDQSPHGGALPSRYTQGTAPEGPADENVMPTKPGASDFVSAYGAEGGVIR